MDNINIIDKPIFKNVIDRLKLPAIFDVESAYDIYLIVAEGIQELIEQKSSYIRKNINQIEIIYYIAGEVLYFLTEKSENTSLIKSEEVKTKLAGIVSDKYLSLSMFNHDEGKLTNRFLPPSSTLEIYLNFMLNIVNSFKKNDPKMNLITDLLFKSLSISRSILGLIIDGYETEAFATWRTLHECECTLIILNKYGDKAINAYLKHMNFGLAFNGSFDDKELSDRVFLSMKEEMKVHDLKSKDIKKFIEYGWMYSIEDFKEDEGYKLNFRDGLERLAGLDSNSDKYELSSEVIHSTPLLIYSNKKFFYYLTLLSLYESFFRLEDVFISMFAKIAGKEKMSQYKAMRDLYYSQLVEIYKRENRKFQKIQK